jgi:two-component system NarL family response regulator
MIGAVASAPIRVVIVEDHPIVRHGLRALLATDKNLLLVGEAGDERDGVDLVRFHRPDVVVMDLRLKTGCGLRALRTLRAERAPCSIVVYSSYNDEEHVRAAIEAGACGYVLKENDSAEILTAIHAAAAGRRYIAAEAAMRLADSIHAEELTARERDVLTFVASGHKNRDIARLLGISSQTVKGHLKHILSKLSASTRTEAANTAIRRGIVRID